MRRLSRKSQIASTLRVYCGAINRRERRQRGAAILMYHAVSASSRHKHESLRTFNIDVADLREHLGFIKARLHVVSLAELEGALRSGDEIDPRWILITFDDGLRCQSTLAAEILGEFAMPWGLSVPTSQIGTGRSVWTYELALLVMECWHSRTISLPGSAETHLDASSERARGVALHVIKSSLMNEVPDQTRKNYIEGLIDSCGRDRFLSCLERSDYAAADWSGLRRLQGEGVTIISHSLSHVPHNSTLSDAELERELQQSMGTLNSQLDTPVTGYALPGGVMDKRCSLMLALQGFRWLISTPVEDWGGSG